MNKNPKQPFFCIVSTGTTPVSETQAQRAHFNPDFCMLSTMKIKTIPDYTIKQINELSPSSAVECTDAYASVYASDYPSDD